MEEKRKNIAGKNVQKWRMKRNLTQEELALESGLSQGYINQLESGKKGFSEGRLLDIAAALGVPISALFEEEEKKDYCLLEPTKVVCKKTDKKELWRLFNKLPEHIAEHYMLLMKMEMDILEGKHLTLEKSHAVR
ncbi:MAG: helix-turn-helix transcriptional regulator [Nitrospinae bacterium]|nr:helix-turn-helix transcriptional regulator [Nitrospinota bacterium]